MTAITIRSEPRITIAHCSRCDRRSWALDGADVSIADVLEVLREDPGLRVARQAARSS